VRTVSLHPFIQRFKLC